MDSTGWHRDPPWNDEIARRIAELDLGKAKTIPWGEVRQRISAKLRNDRKPVRLHEDVDAEYEDAFDWYLARSPHAAAEFGCKSAF